MGAGEANHNVQESKASAGWSLREQVLGELGSGRVIKRKASDPHRPRVEPLDSYWSRRFATRQILLFEWRSLGPKLEAMIQRERLWGDVEELGRGQTMQGFADRFKIWEIKHEHIMFLQLSQRQWWGKRARHTTTGELSPLHWIIGMLLTS